MSSIISDSGLQFVDGNVITSAAAMPITGSFTTGNIVLNNVAANNAKLLGWKRLTTGASNVLNTDWLEITSGITLATSVATTSGTLIDFTGIPSWARRITLSLVGFSTNGTAAYRIQLGTSLGVEITNYIGSYQLQGGVYVAPNNLTAGFDLVSGAAANVTQGEIIISLQSITTNTWTAMGMFGFSNTPAIDLVSGSKALAQTLDRVRLTTGNGTDAFDAGSVNISWE